jgi:hypothetical protein
MNTRRHTAPGTALQPRPGVDGRGGGSMRTRCGPDSEAASALGGHAHCSRGMAQGVDDDLVALKEEVAAS